MKFIQMTKEDQAISMKIGVKRWKNDYRFMARLHALTVSQDAGDGEIMRLLTRGYIKRKPS